MCALKPFRFGVIAEQMTTRDAWIAKAQRVEELGYSTLLFRDHVVPDFFGNQFAPIAAMMSAADATTTLRIGTMVIDNDFRHPVMLAKEAATIDLLTGGRLELGIGAGWLAAEYEKSGIPYDPAGTRISRMIESITIMKGLWRGEPVTFHGDHYRIDDLICFPRPAQQSGPPILIGGGSKRILTYAGREADIIGVLTTAVGSGVVVDEPLNRTTEKVAERIGWIRDGAGERFGKIELSMIPSVIVTDDRRGATAELIAKKGWKDISVEQVWDMPTTLIGTVEEISEQLISHRESLGFSYIVFSDNQMELMNSVVKALTGE